MTNSNDILADTVFSPVGTLQESYNSYTSTKCRLSLEISYFSNESPTQGLWDTIPRDLQDDFTHKFNLPVQEINMCQHFTCF